jgi:hypothetical protein
MFYSVASILLAEVLARVMLVAKSGQRRRKMTDIQLYLAIGIPSALFALNFLAILWQARGLTLAFNTRIDSLEKVMLAKFEAVDAKFGAVDAKFDAAQQGLLRVEQVLDARLKHLEDRER